ncbi:MAG: hypothetical protein JWR07_1734 [Nevskia sp.]|nr:hypothetical protein [Nevskia sp.]
MTTAATVAPDAIPAQGDPGDETARRFRYQWTLAAIACCMLLDDIEEVAEVFCEHHEDVLLKHTDGRFTGQQIKTRGSDQPVWKTGDEAVKDSCARFARLQAVFGDQFRGFQFLTNHPMYAAENGADLGFVLQQCRDAASLAAVPMVAMAFVKKVAKTAGCTHDIAFAALSKTVASDDFPKLTDARIRLVDTLLPLWPPAQQCTSAVVRQVAERLIEACGQASALAHEDLLPAYLPMSKDPVEAEVQALIEGKRITKERLLQMLDQGLNPAAPLVGDPADVVPPGSGTVDMLQAKLDAGGFSLPSIHAAEDLRNKADYLGLSWTQKYGNSSGLQRYDHVRSMVLVEGAGAFEAAKTDGKFGLVMQSQLRGRLQQRRKEGANFYDCSNEHLEGFAYALTAQCKLQWSHDRPWEKKE